MNKRQFYPYTIYTRETHENHARNPIFYKIEQKGLSLETFREISTSFAKNAKIPPYTMYTNQNHEYHAENLIFYSIEQKGLFTDNGRRTPPPQSTPMGSRLASLLLSVRACGSSQGESPGGGHFSAKIGRFALRERFRVSRVEICLGSG